MIERLNSPLAVVAGYSDESGLKAPQGGFQQATIEHAWNKSGVSSFDNTEARFISHKIDLNRFALECPYSML